MIIKSIKIKNYKTYLSLDLDLSVKADRPIILIGGMNGGGKTTLFEAICGALYGLKVKDKEHFNELLNNGAIGKVTPEISLELTFEGMVLGQVQKYILKRYYRLNPSDKPVESVALNMNGNQFIYGTAMPLSQRAQSEQQVNKIIKANLPQELSKYFLFDAMQSSELLKENVFAQIIQDNIQNVMGFNKYIQLKNASEHLQQEWAARRLEAQKEANEYNALCEQKSNLLGEQDINTAEQDRLYKYIVSIQEDYDAAKEGAKNSIDTQRKIELLESSITETKDLSKRYNSQQKESLKRDQEGILNTDQIREVTIKILSYLKSKLLCPKDVDEDIVVDYLANQQQRLQHTDKYAFLDETELDALKGLLNANSVNEFIQLNDMHYDLEKRLDNFENQQKQIDILRRSQVAGNTEIIKAYEDYSKRLDLLEQKFGDRTNLIAKLERQIHQYDVQIQQEPDIKFDTLVKLR